MASSYYNPNAKQDWVVHFQNWLRNHGQNVAVDGVWGPQTEAAYNATKSQGADKAIASVHGGAPSSGSPVPGSDPNKPPSLGAVVENQYNSSRDKINFDYDQQIAQLNQDVTLSQRERLRQDAAINQERDMRIRSLTEDRNRTLTALHQKFGDLLKQQPEQFAARGLYHSGLLVQRLGDINVDQQRQEGDINSQVASQIRDATQQAAFSGGQVNRAFLDKMQQLSLQRTQLGQGKTFTLRELDLDKAAKQAELAAQLNQIVTPA